MAPKGAGKTEGGRPIVARVFQPKLQLQQVVPEFKLPSTAGERIGPWDFKQRRNLVLFFFHTEDCEGCADLLREFAKDYPLYIQQEAEILAITTRPLEQAQILAADLSLPFPVLSDSSGEATREYTYLDAAGQALPSVFVVDRFGALYTQVIAERESQLPSSEEILEWLGLIEVQCPECGVPEWPSLGM